MRRTTLFALAVSLSRSVWLASAWMPLPPQREVTHPAVDTTGLQWQHARALVRLDDNKRRQSPPVGDNDGASYSYVEGLEFDNERDEILAMGGDPSFLPPEEDDDDNGATDAAAVVPPPPPDTEEPKFLWDGEVIEDAYFDD